MASSSQPSGIFRTRAHNTASESENKIHDDRIAAAYGFRGGLVPGVTVYGYMVPAVLDVLGLDWLERGSINFRLHAPCYEGDLVLSRCDGSQVLAEQEDGSLYASGTVSIGDSFGREAHAFPACALPDANERPVASRATIIPGTPLGSLKTTVDVAEATAIPERLLRMANEILVRNFRMSPWIHAGSAVQHLGKASCGQEVMVTGRVEECFEKKGRTFAVAAIHIAEADSPSRRALAWIRHTFIHSF